MFGRFQPHAITATLVACAVIAGATAAQATRPAGASAGGPPCASPHWWLSCIDGGWKGDLLCTANVRIGWYRSDNEPVHDSISNSGWILWGSHDDAGGVAINGGCGGPTSMLWYLLYKGWVHKSVLYTHQ